MRTRTQSGVPAEQTRGAQPAPPPASRVACPECFQVGEHLDGCPAMDNEPAPSPSPTTGHAEPPPRGTIETVDDYEHYKRSTAEKIEARGEPGANQVESTGQVVEATWGEELFQPVQYNMFRVGPFKACTLVRKGESVARALLRLHEELEQAARQIRDKKADEYVAALTNITKRVAPR
jgi:hypothetical protein